MNDAAATPDPAPSRPRFCFSWRRPPNAVRAYFALHRGELPLVDFLDDCWDSPHPRNGRLAACDFVRVPDREALESRRFPRRGYGCWGLEYDYAGSMPTAMLLAAATALGGAMQTSRDAGMAGAGGVESGEIWLAFLDGGVGVRLDLGQDEHTNAMEGYQSTTVRGSAALAAIFALLDFELPDGLYGDIIPPDLAAVRRHVDHRLRAWHRRREGDRARHRAAAQTKRAPTDA